MDGEGGGYFKELGTDGRPKLKINFKEYGNWIHLAQDVDRKWQ
jgi:hypothetical protein